MQGFFTFLWARGLDWAGQHQGLWPRQAVDEGRPDPQAYDAQKEEK
jgi:hypothetical protein